MNEELEFLNFVSKNAQMGVDSIRQLIEITKNENFKEELKKQFTEYESILKKTNEIIEKNSENIKSTSLLQKVETYLMVSVKTLLDKSPDNIAGMLMQGSVMGIIQIIRRLKQYKDKVDSSFLELGQKLLEIEEHNLEKCKIFLGEKE